VASGSIKTLGFIRYNCTGNMTNDYLFNPDSSSNIAEIAGASVAVVVSSIGIVFIVVAIVSTMVLMSFIGLICFYFLYRRKINEKVKRASIFQNKVGKIDEIIENDL
jgi:hypothetical protein